MSSNVNVNLIMIICAAAILVLILIENVVSKRICNRLTQYVYTGQFEKYTELRNKGLTRYLIHPFNLHYSDFNKAIIQANKEEIETCLEKLENMRLSKRQKAVVYARAFYYYVLQRDQVRATRYYHLAGDFNDSESMRDIDIFFDTFIKKGYAYLDEMLECLETAPNESLSDYESLISQMYENKGDKVNAEKYKDLAEKHFQYIEKATRAN